MRSRLILALLLLLAACTPARAEQVPYRQVLPEWEAYVEKARQDWGVPSTAVAVVTPEGIAWWKGFGDRASGLGPPDKDTVYPVGSTTKAFAAATLAMMVDGGGPGWDDRVVDHLPGFQMYDPWVTRELRVVDLLAMRTGMPRQDLTSLGILNYPPDRIVAAMRWVPPVTSFRSHFAYVNSIHLAAGNLVARWSGSDDWLHFLGRRLLQPLGMTRTTGSIRGFQADANRAEGHVRVEGELRTLPPGPFPYVFGPAGGLNSTLEDMSRWLRLNLGEGDFEGQRLISRENLQVTHTPQTMVTPEMFYCLGWMKRFQPGYRLIWHNGGTPGHTVWVGFQPERRVALVVLTDLGGTQMPDAAGFRFFDLLNGEEGPDYSALFLANHREAQERARGARTPPADARPPLPGTALEGRYTSPALGDLRVEGGVLHFLDTGYQARLIPFDGPVHSLDFTDPWMRRAGWNRDGTVRFTSSLSGDVDGFDIRLGEAGEGAVLRADRVPKD